MVVSATDACRQQVIGTVPSDGDSDGATGLRAIKEYGGTALVLHPEDAAKPFIPRAAIAAGHPDGCLPVQKIVRFVGSYGTRYRTLPAGFLPWRATQEVP